MNTETQKGVELSAMGPATVKKCGHVFVKVCISTGRSIRVERKNTRAVRNWQTTVPQVFLWLLRLFFGRDDVANADIDVRWVQSVKRVVPSLVANARQNDPAERLRMRGRFGNRLFLARSREQRGCDDLVPRRRLNANGCAHDRTRAAWLRFERAANGFAHNEKIALRQSLLLRRD